MVGPVAPPRLFWATAVEIGNADAITVPNANNRIDLILSTHYYFFATIP
jgi:hypothetical protein